VLDQTDGYRRTAALGERVVAHLRREVGGHGSVRDIRGIGLMVGVELADKDVTDRVCRACLAAGVIVLSCGPDENVLRLVPPLTITDTEIDRGLAVLCGAIRSTS
jgi:4-aminobutyrate aminotransferase-like enzyme